MSASAQAIHQQTRINDDVAEKAKRRKSAHFSAVPDNNSISDENVNPKNQAGKRVMSGIAIQKQGLIQKRGKRLSAVEPNMPEVRIEVKENKYEEWMKLATDNVYSIHICILKKLIFFFLIENNCEQYMEFCPYRLLCRSYPSPKWSR